jgi:uncharacterized protein
VAGISYNQHVPEDPVCVFCRRRTVTPAWRPFCSERCKLLDLSRWIEEDYRVSGEPADPPTDSDEQDED